MDLTFVVNDVYNCTVKLFSLMKTRVRVKLLNPSTVTCNRFMLYLASI